MFHRMGRLCFRALIAGVIGLALMLLLRSAAMAGAWPREKGKGFVSAASRVVARDLDGPFGVYSTLYFEYGLGRDLTAGFDVGHGVSGNSKAVLFLRLPLGEIAPGHLLAGELGVGRIAGEAVLRPGLSYGHGLSRRNGGSGWLSLESFAEVGLVSQRIDYKADFTLGFNHGTRLKSILQLQTGKSHGDPAFARFAPSMVMPMGRRNHVELGLTADLLGGDHFGVKIGFWHDF